MRSQFLAGLVVVSVLLAGCSDAGVLDRTTQVDVEKKPVEPKLVDAVSTGGGCVPSPANRVEVTRRNASGRSLLVVTGNVSVPDAAHSLDQPKLVKNGWRDYMLRVNSRKETGKAERGCPALANYTATVEIPDGGPNRKFTLTVVHDGDVVQKTNVTSE
ncbi:MULTISPECIES: hypothetical protein [unclassified Haladaptatus]|uniref:hypothetical protein n=1 Tax=unclassified Haladaptatus TaxID=2622732 RepID=UPI00209C5C0D|nr:MULTISPECIES: hypothetical protein [unclassified Haladaptatus]MCO8243024.1 hypothetical protein [Haladaptatus sp. AB643]MCO8252738.1 hypothetical protein [Haladaptatus sp. AB618]